MTDYYVDFNRGVDTNTGTSSATPWKNLSKVAALAAGSIPAGSTIYLADDSTWDIQETLSADQYLNLSNLTNGTAGSPITITGYGNNGSKPHISYTMLPQAAWWTWDAVVEAWYLDLSVAIWGRGGIGVIIGGVYAVSAGAGIQSGAASVINTIVGTNGVTADTLRWVVPSGGTRLYLAGAGINAETDPTTAYGDGSVIIYPAAVMHGWNAFANTVIDGLEFSGGGLYLTYGAGTLNLPGFEMKNCIGSGLGGVVQTVGNTTATDSLIELNIHDNSFSYVTRMGVYLSGPVTGRAYNNMFSHGNLCQSAGGFFYMQVKRNTGGQAAYVVHDNYAEYAAHGVGERQFDGACYYADYGDDGTQFLRNVAAHCFKPYQLNSGAENVMASNIAYDCVKFGSFTDAEAVGASDYTLANNLWVSSLTPDAYSHGAAEDTAAVISAWCNIGKPITRCKIQNNMLVVRGGGWGSTAAIEAYPTTMWAGGGVTGLTIDTNAVIGGQITKYVMPSNDSTDKSSIYAGTVIGGGAGVVYASGLPTALLAPECVNAGSDTQISGIVDFNGNAFQAFPSIGPFEPVTLGRWI